MMVKNKTNKNYKRSQKGRSMVEMLGVLAIVGVLSVGGVYGYGVAMKKHKANELLHQASMLATTISAQIQSKGELPQSIEDFGNGKYGTFGTPEKVNDEQFEMKITGMDSAVCAQVAKMSGGMVRKAECDGTTLTLTYNNNLSSDKVAADYNGDEPGCESSGRKYCDNDTCIPSSEECPTGGSGAGGGTPVDCSSDANACSGCQTCQDGVCKDDATQCLGGTCTNGSCTCSDGKEMCGTTCCSSTQLCGSANKSDGDYTCYNPNIACTKNSDCDSGEYCKISASYCNNTFTSSTACTATSDSDLTPVTYNGKTFYAGPAMKWWAAENFCLAHGKKLASLGSLGLSTSYSYTPPCKTLLCYDKYWNESWTVESEGDCTNGNYECSEYDPNGPLYTAFNAAGVANRTFWTSTSNTSCYIWVVGATSSGEEVGTVYRTSNFSYPLCE